MVLTLRFVDPGFPGGRPDGDNYGIFHALILLRFPEISVIKFSGVADIIVNNLWFDTFLGVGCMMILPGMPPVSPKLKGYSTVHCH